MTNQRLAVMMLLALPFAATACMGTVDDGSGGAETGEAIVGGTFEQNYKFPWEVSLNGCHGVLIDPSWVLTAAHCVTTGVFGNKVLFTRTDPYTGTVKNDYRMVTSGYGAVYIHPAYVPGGGFDNPVNDIALVRVDSPFTIDPNIQTVAIPATPHIVGMSGVIASGGLHAPPGYDAVMRAAIPSVNPSTCAPPNGAFCLSSPTTALCPGDSGSGFVTVESGRAVVRGIASFHNLTETCDSVSPNDYAALTDVYTYHDWILQTMGRSDVTLAGNTRVRASGHLARGVVGIGCTNPDGTMYSPTNVAGTQVGANCAPGDTQSVVCSISSGQTDPILAQPIVISKFTMTTTSASGTTTTALPLGSTFAAYYGVMPSNVVRQFTCEIGPNSWIIRGGGGSIGLAL